MSNFLKRLLVGLAGVCIGLAAVSFIRNGEIDWYTAGFFLTLIGLILLFRLGLSLYEK